MIALGRRAWLAAGFAFGATCLMGSLASAQSKPGEKWRESRVKVPEVSVTTAIEPADAKPGDTVKYTVTVKVAAPWHIYAWAEQPPEEGPRPTQFNLYDTGGLAVDTEWKPNHDPELAKEPAFPNLESVAFHEKEVVWSMPLKVPADAAAGAVTVKGQMKFQICNEGACKPPTTVALPDATVKVGSK